MFMMIAIMETVDKRKERKNMNLSTNKNINGELVDLDQACSITNLGRNTVRNLASSAGAIRKIGRCSRIRKDLLLDYIEKNCKAE